MPRQGARDQAFGVTGVSRNSVDEILPLDTKALDGGLRIINGDESSTCGDPPGE